MYFILFVIHQPEFLEEVLERWEQAGVGGVTILRSTGLGRVRQKRALREDMPLMPSLAEFFETDEDLNRTIFTLVETRATVDAVRRATEEVVGSLEQPNTGMMLVLPVMEAYGGQRQPWMRE